jgi:hypothetical protein
MEQTEIKLPFNLRLKDVLKMEVGYERRTLNPESLVAAIRISGNHGVTFRDAHSPTETPVAKSGKADPVAIVALLRMFSDAHFFEMDEDQTDPDAEVSGALSLSIPGRSKRVEFSGVEVEALERLMGAIWLTAGLKVPELFQSKA